VSTAFTTSDPRIRVVNHGRENWRTEVNDPFNEPATMPDWHVTGPPYPTKAIAMGHVDDVLADYFGELPSRALLADRIDQAVKLAREVGGIAGDHHKAWVICQMVEMLTGGRLSMLDKGMRP
jgi:hypothetical protein